MFIPALFLLGIIAIHALTRAGDLPAIRAGTVFQTQPKPKSSRPSLGRLLNVLRRGEDPEEWIVNDAMAEAYDLGDWHLVAKLHHRFYAPTEEAPIEEDRIGQDDMIDQDEPSEDDESDQPDDGIDGEENEPPDYYRDGDPTVPIPSPSEAVMSERSSPLEGVPIESWDHFVASLETQPSDYQGPKHVGRFHHSRERLALLGIDDVSTAEKQYEALVTDLTDAREKAGGLISEFEFQPIAVNGGEQVITLSGILAVIKSAGMEQARSWFVHPEDRTKFPKTTEMFSKTNGVF